MKWYLWGAVVLLYSLFGSACSTERRYDLSAYGLSPVENVDNAPAMARALEQIREKCEENQTIVVTLPKGRYEFYPDSAAERVYFISNHDQMNPKKVGLPFEGMKNMVFDGQGSVVLFYYYFHAIFTNMPCIGTDRIPALYNTVLNVSIVPKIHII